MLTVFFISAWGFALVITSFLFLWLGHLLDEWLGTGPKFMLGLFLLGIIGNFIAIYRRPNYPKSEATWEYP
ncbi:MAG: hypothetical protein CVU55_04065 [Deltaproteobacteria bacterium HGW-Deltaproteobacteria-13]|nr:MAG: hypothetical protein CVU55_04065 [Deltaproteobacteria bacterium HGW-Deltaproteobacteria-13]